MATPALRDTFDSALNFIARFADKMRSLDTSNRAQQMRNVSAATLGRGNRGHAGRGRGTTRPSAPTRPRGQPGRSGTGRGMKVVDQYYPYDEWVKLTLDQHNQVRLFNQKRHAKSVDTKRSVKLQLESSIPDSPTTRPSEVGAVMSNRKPSAQREL
jgi:hypothetical protein